MNSFSSADVPPLARLAAYEAALDSYFGRDYVDKHIWFDSGEPERFSASMEPFALGQVRGAFHTNNVPHRIFLVPDDTTSGGLDFYLVLNGEVVFDCAGGPLRLRSGDMALLPATEPLSSYSSQINMIALHVPERLVRGRGEHPGYVINRTISGHSGIGACLGGLLRAAADRRHELSVAEGLILQSAVVDTVLHATALDFHRAVGTAPEQQAKLHILQRHALSELHCPDLSPQRLAHGIGISTRTLHRLFQSSGVTFRDWVRERRLERCWQELTDRNTTRRSVAEVAFRWGFSDLSTFNRSFRTKYGLCPSAARLREEH